jgi:hypothetical protein
MITLKMPTTEYDYQDDASHIEAPTLINPDDDRVFAQVKDSSQSGVKTELKNPVFSSFKTGLQGEKIEEPIIPQGSGFSILKDPEEWKRQLPFLVVSLFLGFFIQKYFFKKRGKK